MTRTMSITLYCNFISNILKKIACFIIAIQIFIKTSLKKIKTCFIIRGFCDLNNFLFDLLSLLLIFLLLSNPNNLGSYNLDDVVVSSNKMVYHYYS